MDAPTLIPDELLTKWKHLSDQTANIFTWTSIRELCWLAECASRARGIIEIGSYHGRSAKVMALANPEARIVCIDNCENAEVKDVFSVNLRDQIHAGKVSFIEATSDWLAQGPLTYPVDFCFIDGGHLEPDVTADIQNILPHMAPGAIMSGHDWRHENMADGVNLGVMANFKLEQVNFYESIWWVKLP